jgi:hypothetical protein
MYPSISVRTIFIAEKLKLNLRTCSCQKWKRGGPSSAVYPSVAGQWPDSSLQNVPRETLQWYLNEDKFNVTELGLKP